MKFKTDDANRKAETKTKYISTWEIVKGTETNKKIFVTAALFRI